MLEKTVRMKVITYGLALIYGTAFVMYFAFFFSQIDECQTHFCASIRMYTVFSAVLFGILTISALLTAQLNNRARAILLSAGGAMCVLTIILVSMGIFLIPIPFIFFNLFVIFYFTRREINALFPTSIPRYSILIIDDDEGFLKMMRSILVSGGYSVLTARTGERGLQVAFTQLPDLIILDVILPGIKGREVCAELKDNSDTKGIPVMFVTVKDTLDDVNAEIIAGGVAHITKPINAKDVLLEVKKILGTK